MPAVYANVQEAFVKNWPTRQGSIASSTVVARSKFAVALADQQLVLGLILPNRKQCLFEAPELGVFSNGELIKATVVLYFACAHEFLRYVTLPIGSFCDCAAMGVVHIINVNALFRCTQNSKIL